MEECKSCIRKEKVLPKYTAKTDDAWNEYAQEIFQKGLHAAYQAADRKNPPLGCSVCSDVKSLLTDHGTNILKNFFKKCADSGVFNIFEKKTLLNSSCGKLSGKEKVVLYNYLPIPKYKKYVHYKDILHIVRTATQHMRRIIGGAGDVLARDINSWWKRVLTLKSKLSLLRDILTDLDLDVDKKPREVLVSVVSLLEGVDETIQLPLGKLSFALPAEDLSKQDTRWITLLGFLKLQEKSKLNAASLRTMYSSITYCRNKETKQLGGKVHPRRLNVNWIPFDEKGMLSGTATDVYPNIFCLTPDETVVGKDGTNTGWKFENYLEHIKMGKTSPVLVNWTGQNGGQLGVTHNYDDVNDSGKPSQEVITFDPVMLMQMGVVKMVLIIALYTVDCKSHSVDVEIQVDPEGKNDKTQFTFFPSKHDPKTPIRAVEIFMEDYISAEEILPLSENGFKMIPKPPIVEDPSFTRSSLDGKNLAILCEPPPCETKMRKFLKFSVGGPITPEFKITKLGAFSPDCKTSVYRVNFVPKHLEICFADAFYYTPQRRDMQLGCDNEFGRMKGKIFKFYLSFDCLQSRFGVQIAQIIMELAYASPYDAFQFTVV
jgi:hypothetical protein